MAFGKRHGPEGHAEDKLSVGRQRRNQRRTRRSRGFYFLPANTRLGRSRASRRERQGAGGRKTRRISDDTPPLVARRHHPFERRDARASDRGKFPRRR